MAGKVVIVTGANAGIGLGTVRELLLLGATVVLCCRSRERGEAAKAQLPPAAGQVEVMDLDLGSFASIRAFVEAFKAKQYGRLDVLVLNAGIAVSLLGSGGFRLNAEGLEEIMGSNFVGHFYLTQLLLPLLRATQGARVIANSSVAAATSYSCGVNPAGWYERSADFADWKQYSQSKLALLLFMRELQRREPQLLCLACHPGVVAGTSLMPSEGKAGLRWPLLERLMSAFLWNCCAMGPEHGCRTTVHLAAAAWETLKGGGFYFPVGQLVPWPWSDLHSRFLRLCLLMRPTSMKMTWETLWEDSEAAVNGTLQLQLRKP